MKLIHISDLHLGKRLGEFRLLEEQAALLDWVLQTAAEQHADGILLAGDIYDRSVPPVEAVTLFDSFLTRLTEMGIPLFAISGNHDSPERISFGSRLFDVLNYVILTLVAFTTILPFIYIIGASFATEYELATRPLFIIPQDVTLDAYKFIFSSNKILNGFGNSIFITVAGTLINLFFTVTMAYAISKTRIRGRNFILNMVIFSMFFSGGMIPGYIVVANMLKLKDTYWSVLLPGAISAYNMMIVKNFFQGIPQELEDSAAIDGCNDLGILWKIVLPLSLPVLATFGLFYAVGHWNSYFGAMIYMSGARDKWPLQVLLREIIILSNASAGDMAAMDPEFVQPPEQSIKMAVIVVSTVPIMCVYPFLQKYFVKGVMVGALKG